ncbi:MAG: hypothetical protein CMF87_05975 [Candidatus Marinimicrobia bacterium]|nr:hypothetical protein [Candidatus Neomarinimicrobiota bacterium]|tara:strand:+ start:41 stop:853 length:813 start_codon:yes stop_codon:yes gene_type:complete
MPFSEIMSGILHPVFKWMHVIAGITWIGLLYFFNFINGHFAATLDADSKKKVVPELMPRALFWFRWGAAWTWFTGVLLLYVVYWHGNMSMGETDGNIMFSEGEVTPWSHSMILLSFAAVFIYDFFYKSSLVKNVRVSTIISYAFVAGMIYLMTCCGSFEYRAYNIHIGTMFGTMMAFNVWFRIWPAQQKIITAIKSGEAPNGDDVALAGLRSKHNTYMSVPLIWTMINQHHVTWEGMFGISGEVWLLIMVALGWHLVFQLYKKSATVKGF